MRVVSEFLSSVTGVKGQPQFITWHPLSHILLGINELDRNNGTQASYKIFVGLWHLYQL